MLAVILKRNSKGLLFKGRVLFLFFIAKIKRVVCAKIFFLFKLRKTKKLQVPCRQSSYNAELEQKTRLYAASNVPSGVAGG